MLAWFGAPVATGRAERESARFAAVTVPAQLQAGASHSRRYFFSRNFVAAARIAPRVVVTD